MPASGAVTCAVKLTPGGKVVADGAVGGEVVRGAGLVPEACGDPLPPPHATRSIALRARSTSRARQRTRKDWINEIILRVVVTVDSRAAR